MDEPPKILSESDIRCLIDSSIKARSLRDLPVPTEDEMRAMCTWVHQLMYWSVLVKATLAGQLLMDISPDASSMLFMVSPDSHLQTSLIDECSLATEIDNMFQDRSWDSDESEG